MTVEMNPAFPALSLVPASTLVSLRAVRKTYPGNPPLTVLDHANVDIGVAEDVAVVGPSGSGKTTLLSIMGTLDHPTSGEVWINQVNTAELPESV